MESEATGARASAARAMRLQKVRDAEIPLHTRLDRLHRHAYEIESTQAKLASVKGVHVGGAAKARPGSSAGAVSQGVPRSHLLYSCHG